VLISIRGHAVYHPARKPPDKFDLRLAHVLNIVTSVLGIWSADVGIDLGTANTLVHVRGRGIVVNEPSVVAVSKRTGHVLAVGIEARRMLGRTPADIVATRPLRNGVIADFEQTEQMIRHFIARAHNRAWHVSHPRVVLGVPSGVTEVEKRAVTDAATMAGAREAHLIEEPMAAAIGAGLPIQSPGGSMIVDIGGGTTEVAVISLGGVVAATSVRVGGDEMDDAVVQYVRRNMGLLIGERTAEDIKIAMGSAFPLPEDRSFLVRGRDLITGLPKTVEMTSAHVREALTGVLIDIVRAVRSTLDATPPELVEDIMERGIVVCGGGALLAGLDQLFAHETLMPVRIADDPLTCVVRGTGIVLEEIDSFNRVLIKTRRARALRT
jgi:rod shape-determining protein MreB and related proteins